MADYFLDTNALVKHYHFEPGTPEVERLWADPTSRLFISRLGVVEAVSVFAKKVRTGVLSATDFGLLRKRLFADVRKRRPAVVRLLAKHSHEALRLLQHYGLVHSLHTLDAMQLAVALDLRSRGMLDIVVTSDHAVLTMAALEGLTVLDPENP